MTITKAPQELDQFESTSVFLAGSIEMGAAEDWQAECGRVLEKAGFHVLNPRRDDWDSSWEQSINNPQFREQVEWELKYLEACSYILLYFSPETKSPISLLELGLHAHRSKHLVVCCPEGFWRRGNVEIVCVRYGIALLTSLDAAVATLREISAVHGDHPEEPANKTIKP